MDIVLLYVLIAPPAAFCAFIGILLLTAGEAFPPFVFEPLITHLASERPGIILFWVIGSYLAAHAVALIVGAIMSLMFRRVRGVAMLSVLSIVMCIFVPSFLATAMGVMPTHPLNGSVQAVITGCGAVAGVVCALSIDRLRKNNRLI